MAHALVILVDLIAIGILAYGIYFPRHRRRDLAIAYVGVNVGVLAVSYVLSSSLISFGLGMGLFGVLSIIRLRSYEIDQQEIAYYFSSLALGLLAGLSTEINALSISLMLLVLAAMFIVDHPRQHSSWRQQKVTVNEASADETHLKQLLEDQLGVTIAQLKVKRFDLIKKTTDVEIRYQVGTNKKVSNI